MAWLAHGCFLSKSTHCPLSLSLSPVIFHSCIESPLTCSSSFYLELNLGLGKYCGHLYIDNDFHNLIFYLYFIYLFNSNIIKPKKDCEEKIRISTRCLLVHMYTIPTLFACEKFHISNIWSLLGFENGQRDALKYVVSRHSPKRTCNRLCSGKQSILNMWCETRDTIFSNLRASANPAQITATRPQVLES